MDLNEALSAFQALEKPRYLDDNDPEEEDWNAPNFTVRLDAGESSFDDERTYRLFIRLGKGAGHPNDELRQVLAIADEYGMTATLANDGVELI